MAIMCRSDLTGGLSGWDEVISSAAISYSQRTRLYKREYNGTDTGFTVTQASSARMALCIVAVRGSFTTIDAMVNITSSADGKFPVPVYTAPQAGTLLLTSSWPITASSSAVTVTSPANWDLWSIETIEYNRLAVATYDIANDESVGGELFSQFVCDSEYATVMVFINPPVFEDTRLNLQAAAWTAEDLKTYLRAHDGLEFKNIILALEAGAFSLNDLKAALSAFYQTQDDVKLFLKTLATFRNDIPLPLKAFGQGLENIRLAASTVKSFRNDIRMFLGAVRSARLS